jgi:predicted alpha/beta superfamily hydrolase
MKKILVAFVIISIHFQANAQFSKNENKEITIATKDSIYSETLKEYREIWVHLPTEVKEDEKYPVLYVLDAPEQFSPVMGIVSHLEAWDMPKTIVIGIPNTDRMRDFTPTVVPPTPGEPYEKSGAYENFIKFMECELAPYLKNKYPVDEMSTIVGHSTAGLFVVSTYVTHPRVFDKYLAIDPSVWWDDEAFIDTAEELLQKDNYQNKSLHINVANSSQVDTVRVRRMNTRPTAALRANLNFHDILVENKKHLDVTWEYYPEDDHRSLIIPSMYAGMKSLFRWYKFKERWRFNTPKAYSKEELTQPFYDHFNTLSTHFKREIKPNWQFVNDVGFFILEAHDLPKRAKAYLEVNVHFYPDESRTYVALGDFYAKEKEKNEAIANYKKAIEIDGSEDAKAKLKKLTK